MVKDMGMDEPRLLTVILDNIKPLNKESFEKAVSFAASVAYKFIRIGFFVRLLTCKSLSPSAADRNSFLRYSMRWH